MLQHEIIRILNRRWLVFNEQILSVRMQSPAFDLPVIKAGRDMFIVELPSLDAVDLSVRIERTDNVSCIVQLDSISSSRVNSGDEEAAVETLLSHHVERLLDLLYPGHGGRSNHHKCNGLAIETTSKFRTSYWAAKEMDAPATLIVQVADELRDTLESICLQPRHLLRRRRQMLPLDRIQQLDDACIRWYVRQPGQTVAEKAGPKQKLLGVVRTDTADTHENRVVRELLELARTECSEYERDHALFAKSRRVIANRRFGSQIKRWLRESEIGRVPRLVGEVQPNYVLQFDRRYSSVWPWYVRLRKLRDEKLDALRWRNRVFAEHVSLAIATSLDQIAQPCDRCDGRMFLRFRSRFGESIDDRSAIGPWLINRPNSGERQVVYLLAFGEEKKEFPSFPLLDHLKGTLADALLIVAPEHDPALSEARVLAIWSVLIPQGATLDDIHAALDDRSAAVQECSDPKVSGLMFAGTSSAKDCERITYAAHPKGSCRVVAVSLPIDPQTAMMSNAISDFLSGSTLR